MNGSPKPTIAGLLHMVEPGINLQYLLTFSSIEKRGRKETRKKKRGKLIKAVDATRGREREFKRQETYKLVSKQKALWVHVHFTCIPAAETERRFGATMDSESDDATNVIMQERG
jgi:hypothetical protein